MATNIGDHRWEGMSNEQLAGVIRQMRDGHGASRLAESVHLLKKAGDHLVHIDNTLREQLGALGIAWQSREASEQGHAATAQAAQYADIYNQGVGASQQTLDRQGSDFERTRNSMPEPETLTPHMDTSVLGQLKNGFQAATTGSMDYTRQAEAAQAARETTVDHLQQYTDASRQGLADFQPLPPAPTATIHATPVQSVGAGTGGEIASSTTTSSVAPSVGGSGGGVAGSGAGYGSAPGTPGGSGDVAGPGGGGGPAGTGGPAGVGAPGGPGAPDRFSGSNPFGGVGGTFGGPSGAAARLGGLSPRAFDAAALGAGIAGTAGGIAGATGEPDRVTRRGRGGVTGDETGRRGAAGGEPEERGTGRGQGSGGSGGERRGGRATGSAPAEETPAARAAQRYTGRGRPGDPIMEPATGRGRDEDTEHVRKYAVEDDDVFNDLGSVAPRVIGEDE